MSPPTPSVARSTLWNHAGKIGEYVIMYLTALLVTRGLGIESNGALASLLSFSSLLLVLTSLGLEVSFNTIIPRLRSMPDGSPRVRYLFRNLAVARAVALFAAGIITVPLFFPELLAGEHLLTGPVALILALTFIRGLVALPVQALTASLRTRGVALINVAARLIEAAGILSMLPGPLQIDRVIQVYLFAGVTQLLAYSIAASDLWMGKASPIPLRSAYTFSMIFWMNTILSFFLGRYGDVMFLSRLLPTPREASLYDASYSLVQIGMMLFTAGLSGVTLSVFSVLAEKGGELVRVSYAALVNLVSLATIPVLMFLLVSAHAVVDVVYGSEFAGVAVVLQAMAAFRIAARLVAGGENSDVLIAFGRIRPFVLLSAVGMIVNVALDLLLIPLFGAWGAAIAGGVGLWTTNVTWYLVVRSILHQEIQWMTWLKLVLPAGAVAVLCEVTLPDSGVVPLAIKVAAYALGLSMLYFILKPLTSTDHRWLSERVQGISSRLRVFAQPPGESSR